MLLLLLLVVESGCAVCAALHVSAAGNVERFESIDWLMSIVGGDGEAGAYLVVG